MAAEYRKYLFPHDHPRLADVRGMDPYTYREVSHRAGTFTGDLVAGWRPHYLEPFHGVTDDGILRPEVHRLDPPCPGEEAPVAAMVAAARELLAVLDEHGRRRVRHPVDAPQWQTWANPEFLQFDTGVRLEFESESVKAKALGLMAASLSPEGYRSARDMMRINGFLGKVVDLPTILHEFGYNIALYGDPHPTDPWGWQLFGHHLALNVLVVGGRMTVGPAFLGAEPNEIDAGEFAGTRSFTPRIDLALQLMAELTPDQRDASTVYRQMVDPAMPEGRVHPGDERHLAGAFQDNRIIPYEGVRVSELSGPAQDLVFAIVEQFVALLPAGPRAARMREIRSFLDETWFSWIGGHERGDVFYFRIQSPVVITELDHHCGVFLDYSTPKPFHIHTVMRTPHGNDYGRAWALQWNAR